MITPATRYRDRLMMGFTDDQIARLEARDREFAAEEAVRWAAMLADVTAIVAPAPAPAPPAAASHGRDAVRLAKGRET